MSVVLTPRKLEWILIVYTPGSRDERWTWIDEFNELMKDPKTDKLRVLVSKHGIDFANASEPITLGSDGRVWDGHHRICLAMELGIKTLFVHEMERE